MIIVKICRKEKLEKEEKKKLEREEKKKQREQEKLDKRAKRSSTHVSNVINPVEEDITIVNDPKIEIPDPSELIASAEDILDQPKVKPTLFQLAGVTSEKVETAEPEPEKSSKKKDKEESSFKSNTKGNDNQLREAKNHIVELEQNNNNLTEKNKVLYSAKCQLENEKDDLQVRIILNGSRKFYC